MHSNNFKLVLKNSIPSILIMFFTGLYLFFDDVFSINFAGDSYAPIISNTGLHYNSVELIRLSLSFSLNILYIVEAIVLMFSIGSSIKYAGLLAEGDEVKIKSFLSSSFKFTLISSILLIPILITLAKPWIRFQYHLDDFIKSEVVNMSFNYIWVVIIATPFLCFAEYTAALLRAERKNLWALLIIAVPLLFNLLFDYLFMGVWNYDIQGGAWATFIAYTMSALLATMVVYFRKNNFMTIKNFWDFKDIRLAWFAWIILIGIAPFIRNFTQSATESYEANNFNMISDDVYSWVYPSTMPDMYVSAMPIYNILFPVMFGYIHAISPILSAEKVKGRYINMRNIIFHTLLQAIIVASLLFCVTILLDSYLLDLMKVHSLRGNITYKVKIVLKILLLSIVCLVPMIVSLTTFTGSQMNKTAILISLLKLCIFIPWLLLWNKINTLRYTPGIQVMNFENDGNLLSQQYTFWWYYPTLSIAISVISSIPLMLTFGRKAWCNNMSKKHNIKQAI